ncbi:AAA family ATPase [Roseovarius tibetensis]|uniref:AAA family ATPase n=1 Tax=Roseovarius tibetensis TaxID=2685897 RepID=UPI003D7FCCD4
MPETRYPEHETLPGLEDAIALLRREAPARRDADDHYADCVLDDSLPEIPDTGPVRVDSALSALTTLQIGAAHAAAGSPGMIPPPGTLHVIEVPDAAARERVARIVEAMVDAGAGSGVQKPKVIEQAGSGQSVDAEMFQRKIEKTLLKGLGVIAISEVGTPLPDKLRRRAALTLPLAQVSAAMLSALLSEIHDVAELALDLSDANAAALADLDIAAIFAAPSIEEARAQLARLTTPDMLSGQVTLEDVHGQPAATDAFRQVLEDLADWRAGALDWSEVTRSFLLHGPPGNGKTMLAAALAGSAGVPLIATSYADNQRLGHQGDMLRGLSDAVTRACASAPSIFFIDEIDAFYTRGRSHNGYMIGVVTGLLTQLDRLMNTDGVILLAATNHPDTVDPAIRRAGRFDRHVPVTAPDRAGVRAILAAGVRNIPAPDLDRLTDRMLGQSGAEITALVRSARTHARRRGGTLAVRDLDTAAADLGPAPDPDTLYRVAVHEAGHLLAGHLFGAPTPKSATLRMGGGVVERPMPDFLTRPRVTALVRMMMGGRAAEALIFNEVSSGAGGGEQSDLAMATQLLIDAETRLGLGDSLVWQPPDITARLLAQGSRARIEHALRTAESEAREALTHHRADLDRIARDLLNKRELTAKDLTGLLDPVDPDTARDTPDSVITPTS